MPGSLASRAGGGGVAVTPPEALARQHQDGSLTLVFASANATVLIQPAPANRSVPVVRPVDPEHQYENWWGSYEGPAFIVDSCKYPGGSASGNISCGVLGGDLAKSSQLSLRLNRSKVPGSSSYTDVQAFEFDDTPLLWPSAPHPSKPGRQVVIAASDIRDWQQPRCFLNGTCKSQGPLDGGGPATVEGNIRRAISIVESAGEHGADVVLLPEEVKYSWVTDDKLECEHYVCAEPLLGTTFQTFSALAAKYRMYVVYGTRENATEENAVYNTAVIVGRTGKFVGRYRKVFPFSGPTNHPGLNASTDGVPFFDLDFGRVSMLTCFDANFAELFQQAEAGGAEVLLWGSAYGGGLPLRAAAQAHGYAIVASGWGEFIDSVGRDMRPSLTLRSTASATVRIATLDLDATLVNFVSSLQPPLVPLRTHHVFFACCQLLSSIRAFMQADESIPWCWLPGYPKQNSGGAGL
jgi:hypothetical protein